MVLARHDSRRAFGPPARLRLADAITNGPNMNSSAINFARIVIPSPLGQPLIYSVPADLRDRIAVGMRVLIPLGKRNVTGVVLELLQTTSLLKTRPIQALPDEAPVLDQTLLLLSQWVAQYYLATLGEALAAILPPPLRRESQRKVVLLPEVIAPNDPLEQEILRLLRQKESGMNAKTLTRQISSGNVHSALERLHSRGAVAIHERIPGLRRRNPVHFGELSAERSVIPTAFTLTP